MSETKAEELIARLRVRKLEIVSAAEARRRIEEWQAEREAEAARAAAQARELLQRHLQETARRVDLAAHAAGTTARATSVPAPPARKVGESPSIGRVQRLPVYARGGSSAYSYSSPSRVDLESQTPLDGPDQGCGAPWLLISVSSTLFQRGALDNERLTRGQVFLLWLFWMGASSG